MLRYVVANLDLHCLFLFQRKDYRINLNRDFNHLLMRITSIWTEVRPDYMSELISVQTTGNLAIISSDTYNLYCHFVYIMENNLVRVLN